MSSVQKDELAIALIHRSRGFYSEDSYGTQVKFQGSKNGGLGYSAGKTWEQRRDRNEKTIKEKFQRTSRPTE